MLTSVVSVSSGEVKAVVRQVQKFIGETSDDSNVVD
jgi:hypothetical protein